MTLEELKYRVLLQLNVVAAGDSPNPDDAATVESRYVALHRLLQAQSLTDWNVSDDIPEEFEIPIVAMMVAECAQPFGNADQMIQAQGKFGLPKPSPAERQIRRLTAKTYVSQPAKAEYF